MRERHMEDLIANYPDDFFPDRGFQLRGRQQSFAEVGRFDLLFEDRFKTRILMELKAVCARYDVASQLAKYKDELQHRGENNILMWLVAPQIPTSVREFLDRIGIEYIEIHVAEFERVAGRHGILIAAETSPSVDSCEPVVRTPASNSGKNKKGVREPILPRSREFIAKAIHRLWAEQRNLVTRDQLAEQLEKQAWVAERLDADGPGDMRYRQKRVGNLIDWFSKEYTSGEFDLNNEFERDKVAADGSIDPERGARNPLKRERPRRGNLFVSGPPSPRQPPSSHSVAGKSDSEKCAGLVMRLLGQISTARSLALANDVARDRPS